MFSSYYGCIIDPYKYRPQQIPPPSPTASSKIISTIRRKSVSQFTSDPTTVDDHSTITSMKILATPTLSYLSSKRPIEKLPFFIRNKVVITLTFSLFLLSMSIVCAYYILIQLNQYLKKNHNTATESFDKKADQISPVYQRNSLMTSQRSDSDTSIDRSSPVKTPSEKARRGLQQRSSFESVELFRV